MKHEIVLFLDVDGTVLPENEVNSNRSLDVERTWETTTPSKTVGGFTIPETTKTHSIVETIAWNEELQTFLQNIQPQVRIVWLTGWKQNAKLISDALNLVWTESLNWFADSTESGKIVAIEQFVSENPDIVFMWADDFATIKNPIPVFTVPHLVVIPEADKAITGTQITEMTQFINQFAG